MSDRHNGYIVTLSNPIKDQDSKKIMDAILMFEGVIDVSPLIDDSASFACQIQVRSDLTKKFWDALYEKKENC